MRTAGIICEYDPFHLGHQHQIEVLRARGIDTVVCLMSGNSTQRGTFACADKYLRAEAALRSGADLVLELPFPFCSASAEFFAGAGVTILDTLGVDEINFGSETADVDRLKKIANVICSKSFAEEYRKTLAAHPEQGNARAYAQAFLHLTGEELTTQSNDILAISYFAAAIRSKANAELTVVKRSGTKFSSDRLKRGEYPSASAIRKALSDGKTEEALLFMPKEAADVLLDHIESGVGISDITRLESAILAHFRMLDPDRSECFAECGDGVGRRLCRAAYTSPGLCEFFTAASTKRYTDAKLRRAVLFSLTGVTNEDLKSTPVYTTLLAANQKGRQFLSEVRKGSGIEIVTKPADAPSSRQRELSQKLDALFALTMKNGESADNFMRRTPKISEND